MFPLSNRGNLFHKIAGLQLLFRGRPSHFIKQLMLLWDNVDFMKELLVCEYNYVVKEKIFQSSVACGFGEIGWL